MLSLFASTALATNDVAMWALIVGFAAPPVYAVLIQTAWPTTVKALVAFILSLVVGAGNAYFAGDLTAKSFVQSALVVIVAAIATYHGFWKPTGIAPAIERSTSRA